VYKKLRKAILILVFLTFASSVASVMAYYYVKDSFDDTSKISGSYNITVSGGKARLTSNPNLVLNPSVENGVSAPDDWYYGLNAYWVTEEAKTGSHSLKLNVNVSSGDWRSKAFLVSPCKTYHFEAYVKGVVYADEFYLTIRWFSNEDGTGFISENNIPIPVGSYPSWILKSGNFTSPSNAKSSDILFRAINGNGTVYADDFMVKLLYPQGMIYSVNLLENMNATSITCFRYDCDLPSGTKLQFQFSQNNRTWFSGDNTENLWDDAYNGIHEIDLTRLNWKADYFFYRVNFTGCLDVSPILYEITVYYDVEKTDASNWFHELFYGSGKWLTLTLTLAIIISVSTIFPYGGIFFLPLTIFLGIDYMRNISASSDFMWGAITMTFASIYILAMAIRKSIK